MPHCALPFINDIGVEEPKTDYDGEKILSGIKDFVFEHIQWLDRVLTNLERAVCIISGAKSQFCMAELKMLATFAMLKNAIPTLLKF